MTAGADTGGAGQPVGRMVEACVAAHEAVRQHGTRELRQLTEMLLLELGRAIAGGALRTGHADGDGGGSPSQSA